MRFIHQCIESGWLSNARLTAVITDRVCPANAYAQSHSIEQRCFDFLADGHARLVEYLMATQPDIVISNIHRILQPELVEMFTERIINLHYSLLPSFAGSIGTAPIKQAIAYGAKFTGVTVHKVTEIVDAGPPLVQVSIPIHAAEQFNEKLMDTVFRCGCLALLTALSPIPESVPQVAAVGGRTCSFSSLNMNIEDEVFWMNLKQANAS